MAAEVVVLVAGIADPKWPLPRLDIAAGGAAIRGAPPTMLSPFDEAALEVGLKLRDADPATRVTAVLLDASGGDALARTVAALRPDALVRIDAQAIAPWDALRTASFCGEVLRAIPKVDLALIGREFGDLDDGALPPCLAELLGWRFAALVQDAAIAGGRLELMRERARMRESIAVAPPFLASVTNDRRNRLRHPLLKNVMAAKRAALPFAPAPAATARSTVTLAAAVPAPATSRATACRLLEGSLEAQAGALCGYLLAARTGR